MQIWLDGLQGFWGNWHKYIMINQLALMVWDDNTLTIL